MHQQNFTIFGMYKLHSAEN